jgi:hypothetical protein
VPNGEVIETLVCHAAGIGTRTQTIDNDTWTIGGDNATNLLNHALNIHPVGGGAPMACGAWVLN